MKAFCIMLIVFAATFQALALTQINIQGFAFTPKSVVITKGETVRWTNLDPIPHTSTSNTGVWDSGPLNQNESYERRFNQTGMFRYHCTFHPTMRANIRVTTTAVVPVSFGAIRALFAD